MSDTDPRSARCPDRGYCHGTTYAIGSDLCPDGGCRRVLVAGPLSGVYSDDQWPAGVRDRAEEIARLYGPEAECTCVGSMVDDRLHLHPDCPFREEAPRGR